MGYVVTAAARLHILFRDASGGGHRSGAGRGKGEFPPSWSDDEIIAAVENIANDPAATRVQARFGRVKVIGMHKSLSVTVVVHPSLKEIVTGYPA
jgi:hypothetical protein